MTAQITEVIHHTEGHVQGLAEPSGGGQPILVTGRAVARQRADEAGVEIEAADAI